MPPAPADARDGIGETGRVTPIIAGGLWPALAALGRMLNADREVEPVELMSDRAEAHGLTQ
jgi:hypothetical protein